MKSNKKDKSTANISTPPPLPTFYMRTCIVVQCREPNKCSNFKEDDSALPLYELLFYSASAIYSYILYMVCAGGGSSGSEDGY